MRHFNFDTGHYTLEGEYPYAIIRCRSGIASGMTVEITPSEVCLCPDSHIWDDGDGYIDIDPPRISLFSKADADHLAGIMELALAVRDEFLEREKKEDPA